MSPPAGKNLTALALSATRLATAPATAIRKITTTISRQFHGTGNAISHVEVKDKADLDYSANQSFSIVAWARPSSLPGHWAGAVTKSREAPSGWYGIYITPDKQWSFRGQENDPVAGGTVTPDSWQQVIGVQDAAAKTRTLYVNGVQVATGPAAQTSDGTGPLWIGQGNADREGFSGNIDEVRIYNRALNADDVKKLFGTYLPIVTLTGVTDNSTVSAKSPLTLTAIASAPAAGATVEEIKYFEGTKPIGSERGIPYRHDWRDVTPGDYVLTATVTDSNDNTTRSAPIHIKVAP